MMPKIAPSDSNKVWVVPSEFTKALEGLGSSIHEGAGIPEQSGGGLNRGDMGSTQAATLSDDTDRELTSANKAVEDAIAEAERSANPGRNSELAPPVDPPADTPNDGTAGAAPAR